MSKLLWFFWLALLQSAFGFAIPNKVAFSAPHSTKIICFCTITYDEQNPVKNVYDVVGLADFGYDSAAVLTAYDKENRTVGTSSLLARFANFLAAEGVATGSGPASGFLEVSDAYSSSKAVQNSASPTATDFIYDSQSQRFVMGSGPFGHDSILDATGITPSETTVGGTIWRENGSLMTDEWSGHYGQNWTPAIRQEFQNFMQQNGVNITHTPWGL